MRRLFAIYFSLVLSGSVIAAPAESPAPAFRTDGGDEKLPWFQLRTAEFPPDGSAHYIAGELIAFDHVNRTGTLRPDRTDAQRRGDWDLPLAFEMLPYGSISYHGAPAELRDIPIGTHLHGQFYLEPTTPPTDKTDKKAAKKPPVRESTEAAFKKVLKLEDDFSYYARQNRRWKILTIQPETGILTAIAGTTGAVPATAPSGQKATIFQFGETTRVFHGRQIGTLADLSPGKEVLLNLTVCTLKGPGRITDVWLDDESQKLATAAQTAVHRQFQREHGLAAWITEIDNAQGIVTATIFGGVDPALIKEFKANEAMTACVAEENLRTWDQVNDRKGGTVTVIEQLPAAPGSSGVRIRFKPQLLLEGFRPKRIVRLFAGGWKVDDLPREERLYP
jgi:hypothetical protein